MYAFFSLYNFNDIFISKELKAELNFIISAFIDYIIVDENRPFIYFVYVNGKKNVPMIRNPDSDPLGHPDTLLYNNIKIFNFFLFFENLNF